MLMNKKNNKNKSTMMYKSKKSIEFIRNINSGNSKRYLAALPETDLEFKS